MPDQSPAHSGACPFCDRDQTRDFLLHESENFYVIADFAPVAEAHILLIPRAHYPHLAAIPLTLEDEFHALKAHIGAFVKEHYGHLTYWENGVFGQSVPHAHLHSLSVAMDTSLISAYGSEIGSLSDLRSHHARNAGHYFLVEHDGVGRVMPPDPQLYWNIISDAKVRNGGTWQYTAAERRIHGRGQVDALIRRWREHHAERPLGVNAKMSQFHGYSRQSPFHVTYATGLLHAIFAGQPQEVADEAGKPVSTSIFKSRVEGPVMVRRLNIDGDRQADLRVHGGVDKAVYCYPAEHYEAWQSELGRELAYGTFGENLTVTGLLEDTLHIDDVIVVGDAVLQVSEPRFPCFKLGIKMGDPTFLKRFQLSGRSGFYCRVLEEGLIEAGQTMEVIERDTAQPTVVSIVAARNKQDGA